MYQPEKYPKLAINQDKLDRLQKSSSELQAMARETKEVAGDVIAVLRDEIKNTTRKFQELAKIVQDGLIVTAEDNTITDYSPAAERIFGWTKEEILGQSLEMLLPANYYRVFLHILNENPDKMISMTNGRAVSKDGSHLDIEFTVSRLNFVGEDFNFIVVRDVTEQISRIQEIKEKNKILSAIAGCSKLWVQKDWKDNIEAGL